MNGQQAATRPSSPEALVDLAEQDEPPLRLVAGADAVDGVEQKADCSSRRSTRTASCRVLRTTTRLGAERLITQIELKAHAS